MTSALYINIVASLLIHWVHFGDVGVLQRGCVSRIRVFVRTEEHVTMILQLIRILVNVCQTLPVNTVRMVSLLSSQAEVYSLLRLLHVQLRHYSEWVYDTALLPCIVAGWTKSITKLPTVQYDLWQCGYYTLLPNIVRGGQPLTPPRTSVHKIRFSPP